MSYLVIDILDGVRVDYYDDSFNLKSSSSTNEKASQCLHSTINSVLEKENLNRFNSTYIFNKGPGSYTGLRLLQGFQDILELEEIECFSFYSFEILAELPSDTLWLSRAFKGEYLLVNHHEGIFQQKRVTSFNKELSYIGIEEIEGVDIKLFRNIEKTLVTKLIKKVVEKKSNQGVFYYRPLEEEFKRK